MLREELTKTASVLPNDLYLALDKIKDDHPMSAYRLNMLAQIICTNDDLRHAITKCMRESLLIALRYAVSDLEQETMADG